MFSIGRYLSVIDQESQVIDGYMHIALFSLFRCIISSKVNDFVSMVEAGKRFDRFAVGSSVKGSMRTCFFILSQLFA